MQDEIDGLRDMLTQLPPDQQQRLVPKLTKLVEWFLNNETENNTDRGSFSHSIGFSFSRTSVRCASTLGEDTHE